GFSHLTAPRAGETGLDRSSKRPYHRGRCSSNSRTCTMAKPRGRSLPVSPYRKLVADLMHFSGMVPAVTADRRMDLSALRAARQAAAVRPSWTGMFSKAYSMLTHEYPELRRAYLQSPWPRIYEHPHNVVSLNVERRLPGEDIVLFCLIRSPENRS